MAITATSGPSSTVISGVRNTLVAAGWSASNTVLPISFSKTFAGKQINFTWSDFTAGYCTFVDPGGNSYFIHTGGTDVTGTYLFKTTAFEDFFYIEIEGPTSGQLGAKGAGGSNRGFFGAFPIKPYWASDTDTSGHLVYLSSNSTSAEASDIHTGRIVKAFDGTQFAPVELATVRPAVQDQDALVGDLVPSIISQNRLVFWDYMVIEQTGGLRGALKHIYFGGDNYASALSGDSSASRHANYYDATIDGVLHRIVYPVYKQNVAIQYSPLGVSERVGTYNSGQNIGGPAVAVRWA